MFYKALMPASANPRFAANFEIVTVLSFGIGSGSSFPARHFAAEFQKGCRV
jgi:Flp pilus assembly CpaE family ATPase